MPLFEKVVPSIPKTYNVPPIPSILPKLSPSSSTQSIISSSESKHVPVPSPNSPVCSNCKNPISKESPEIKCEGGHACCNICFQAGVNVAIRFKMYFVPCAVTRCENNYSEETTKSNIIVSLYEKLLLFKPKEIIHNEKETPQTPKVTSTSDSPKQISTRTIHKKITYSDNYTHEGELVIDLVFFFFFKNYYLYFQQIHYLFITYYIICII
jgi:hypothetical protein